MAMRRVIFGKVFDCIVLQMLVIVNNITVAGKSLYENEREATDSVLGYIPQCIAAESNRKILCAHCDCKAGLGECCSHVASLL